MSEHKYFHDWKFFNDGVDDLPEQVGDRLYGVDLVRDFRYLQGMVGKAMYELLNENTGLLKQGAIAVASWTTLNIEPHTGVIEFDVEVGNDDLPWIQPQTKMTRQIHVLVELPTIAGFDLAAAGATLNGATPNYLKLAYAETPIMTRSREYATGSFYYAQSKSYVLTCTAAAATAKELTIATVVGDGASFLTVTPVNSILPGIAKHTIIKSDNLDTRLYPLRRYLMSEGCTRLTLPEVASPGDAIVVIADATGWLLQPLAGSSIEYLKKYYTTKGVGIPPPSSSVTGCIQMLAGERLKMTYKGIGQSRIEPGVKIADPAALPAGTGNGCAFSEDGRYCAVTHSTTPFITIYKRTAGTDTFVKLDDPATIPGNTAYGPAFSRDGTYLGIGCLVPPYYIIYKRTAETDTFVKIADAAAMPAGAVLSCAFSPNGIFFAVAHSTSPYVTIYKRTAGTDTFVKLADPGTLPTGVGHGVSFSRNGSYLAVAHVTSPYVTIYRIIRDVFSKVADPGVLPTGTGNGCAFTPDGSGLAVAHNTSPYITIYRRAAGTDIFLKTTEPLTLPAADGNGCSFSEDGTYLSVAHTNSPYFTLYKADNDSYTKIANPGTLPTGNATGCSFSINMVYLAIAHATSPYVTIYKIVESVTNQWIIDVFSTRFNQAMGIGEDAGIKYRFK